MIWKKYQDSPTANVLKSLTCSEPTASVMYCLPEDHKDGYLKGRPIVAAVDTPAVKLSKFLANVFNKLLHHVPAHVESSYVFKRKLLNLTLPAGS